MSKKKTFTIFSAGLAAVTAAGIIAKRLRSRS